MADNNRNWEDRPGGYSQDWNQDRERYDRDYDQRRRNENRGYNRGGQGDMSHTSYGEVYGGNVERRERETNMAQGRGYDRRYSNREQRYGGGQDYNPGDYGQTSGMGSGYGTSGGYGSSYRSGYDRDNDRNPQNRYGGDTRNYGNANQGGMDRDWWDRARDKVSSWFGGDQDRNRDEDTSRTGLHRGKGPRGYTRSDTRIQEDVCDRLYDDAFVDASDVEVKVEGSEVILSGTVHSREEKRRAEDLAEQISGVRNVQNQLRVQREEGSSSGYRSTDSSRDRW